MVDKAYFSTILSILWPIKKKSRQKAMCSNNIQKVSIRFFNDREVRAVWDETLSEWWFSVLDVVGVLNNQDDYTKNRNYWKYLKTKLKKEGNELVSATNQLKLLAQDGKPFREGNGRTYYSLYA